MFYPIMRFIAYIVLRPIYAYYMRGGLRFEGTENVPRKGGVLITPNHICYADPPTVAMATSRHSYLMAWDELFNIKILGTVIKWLRAFPVKPGTPDRHALKFAEDRLKEGHAVIVFPEGTVSSTGELLPLRPGVLMVAQRANVPIVPTIVENTNLMLPYEQVKARIIKQPVTVRFGKPVTVEELSGGVKGGEGYKIGAERLFLLMRALQENKPYPELGPVERPKRVRREAGDPDAEEPAQESESGEPALANGKE
jgi:1-acyl-sn-glycerol-3-phosphate acyltransferase